MKKLFNKVLIPILITSFCLVFFIGCNSKESPQISNNNNISDNNENNDTKIKTDTAETSSSSVSFTDDKNTCTITVPKSSWVKMSKDLNKDASLIISNSSTSQCLGIIAESKEDFPNISDMNIYREAVYAIMSPKLTNPSMTKGNIITIDGKNAVQFELSGTTNSISITYLITVVEGKNNVYQILCWTYTNNMDNVREDFINISNTFKEL